MNKSSILPPTHNIESFLGIPIPYKNFLIRTPTIRDTLNPHFWMWQRALTVSEEDLDDEFSALELGFKLTPFQYLLIRYSTEEDFKKTIDDSFQFFLSIEIIVNVEEEEILLGSPSEFLMSKREGMQPRLKEDNFLFFQNLIRTACGMEPYLPIDPTLHPRAQEMERKRRYRDRIKNKKQTKGSSYMSLISSVCVMGIGITPFNIGDLSYAAFLEIVKRYELKQRSELDILVATNPYSTNREISNWME